MSEKRSWLGWLLNLPPRSPPTRLTPEEAVEIAATDPSVVALGRALAVASVSTVDGRSVWTVGSGGTGAQWWVEVDDLTGSVGELQHFHGR